jgi:hypothetical protein
VNNKSIADRIIRIRKKYYPNPQFHIIFEMAMSAGKPKLLILTESDYAGSEVVRQVRADGRFAGVGLMLGSGLKSAGEFSQECQKSW